MLVARHKRERAKELLCTRGRVSNLQDEKNSKDIWWERLCNTNTLNITELYKKKG